MATDAPKTHVGIAVAAVVAGGAAMLAVIAHSFGYIAFVAMMPWLLGVIGLYHAVRGAMLDASKREDIESRGQRALHFSIFSLSITGVFVVIVLMAYSFSSSF